ncbi:hypothetical protein [Paucisalibacillus globulus]|uniref:hypothetical protein n=1 Tax=Paucisalibacillus globulus TaxID=351095 RepID=UPI000BB9B9C8|nr:hypothetical protein [Paucisalibacillus globulus]
MKNNNQLDYTKHYESVLATKDDMEKIKASDFLHYFSELIIKYSNQIENKMKNRNEGTYNGV